jgi:tRNA(Arg) A34 adenosine deaminase TadA
MANALWAGLDRVVFGATIEDANQYCRQIQVSAAELTRRSDMRCIVNGPVLRELCNTLFTDPRMQAAFATWGTRKA